MLKQKLKLFRELKRDIEATILSDNELDIDDGSNPYKMRGLGKWIQNGAQGTNPVPSAYRTPADNIYDISTSGAFTETAMNNIITSIYRVSGAMDSLTLVADTALRRESATLLALESLNGWIWRCFYSECELQWRVC